MVELLLLMPNVSASANRNRSLIMACSGGHTEIVEKLLMCTDVDASVSSSLCFRLAAAAGHYDVVQRLLSVPGVQPSACNNFALRRAAARGHYRVVELLLRLKMVTAPPETLFFAARHGHLDVVQLLLSKRFCRASAERMLAVRLAAGAGHSEIVETLLRSVVENGDPLVTADVTDAFVKAAKNGCVDAMKTLLRFEGVHIDTNGCPAIKLAAAAGHCAVIAELLDLAEIDVDNASNAFVLAASSGHLEVVRLFLDDSRLRIPIPESQRALREAASIGALLIIDAILERFPLLDVFSSEGEALLRSATNGHADVVSRLLKHKGADSFIHDALLRASAHGHVPIIESLLSRARSRSILLALCASAQAGEVPACRRLLQSVTSNPNRRERRDAIANSLVAAAENGHAPVVDILLQHGAESVSQYPQALLSASQRGHGAVVSLLMRCRLPRKLLDRAVKTALSSGTPSVVAELLRDPYIYDRYGKPGRSASVVLLDSKARETMRMATMQLAAERDATLRICLLLRRASWPLWSCLRHRIMLFSHAAFLEGDTDAAKMDDLKGVLKRVDFSLMLAGAPSIGSTTSITLANITAAAAATASMSTSVSSVRSNSNSRGSSQSYHGDEEAKGYIRSRRRSSYQIMLESLED